MKSEPLRSQRILQRLRLLRVILKSAYAYALLTLTRRTEMTNDPKDLTVIVDSMIRQQKRINEESNVGILDRLPFDPLWEGPEAVLIDCIKDLMEIVDRESPEFRTAKLVVDNWHRAQLEAAKNKED
jgi:hypothetical protein